MTNREALAFTVGAVFGAVVLFAAVMIAWR